MTKEEAINFLKSINKEDTAVCCDGALFTLDEYGVEIINMAIEALKSERPKGHWIGVEKLEDRPSYKWYRCSECEMLVESRVNYCPNCGADMKGADDE